MMPARHLTITIGRPPAEVYAFAADAANLDGSEVVFTLLRAPGTTDAQHAADVAAVERDLQALKRLLER